ncbi:MAG: DNA polymerase, partial [Actinomycetota bacterium]|nr:DNA polymerase [Actinomycetota bacterium]
LDKRIMEEQLKSRIVLQVHDEVILECPTKELLKVQDLTIEIMSAAFDLLVPLEVNISSGQSWADAK